MQLLGSEVVDGTDCYIIRLTRKIEGIPYIEEIAANVWISKNDYLIRQVTSITSIPDSEPAHFQVLVKSYYDFNEPINIEPPLPTVAEENNQ